MTSGSIGSHRAFMGVSITLCVCLVLTLFVGWSWYFESVENRNVLIELARKAEERVRDLEKMGLTIDAGKTEAAVEPTIETSISSPAPVAPVTTEAPPATPSGRLFPGASIIKEVPLMESGEDVVQALALLDKYWGTDAWKDRLPFVYDPDRTGALMKDFYDSQGGSDPMPGGLLSKKRYLIDGMEILYFSYTSNRPAGTLEVAMRRGAQGSFLIDWESLVGYGEMSFQALREQRPGKPVTLRAYVRLFEYYNFEFSSASKYLCVKLTSPDGNNSIYAYCDRGSELSRWLESDLALAGATGFKGYTLLVYFPENAQSSQCVMLEKVLEARWLRFP